jgi:trehalose-6-phosphate synthase
MNINAKIGWFLHTPFPAQEFFDTLPFKNEILDGILGADVVGFQTDEDRRHFSNTCSDILCVHHPTHTIREYGDLQVIRDQRLDGFTMSHDNRPISVQTFPIGIEPAEFHTRLWKKTVQNSIRSMRDKFRGEKVIVGVDRLDCIKGLPQKLLAFERFLEKNPSWVGKATLVQVVVPSRDGLESHKDLKEMIQQLVGRINGKYGELSPLPSLTSCTEWIRSSDILFHQWSTYT